MIHKQLKSKRGIVHYWTNENTSDNDKCIVFTHGLTANNIMFEKQVEYFKKKYKILTWDVPLHGKSRPYEDFSYMNTAIELNSILEIEDIQKIILIGLSMGGYVSQMFSDMYPDKVLGFVALDTTPFGLKYYSKSDKWWLNRVESMAKWFPVKMLRNSMAKSVSRTKYSYNTMLKMLEPLDMTDICRQLGIAYGCFLKENKDMKFNFPVLILLGEHDKTGKVKRYCEQWSKEEGYPLNLIEGAAHFSNGDNPESVNKEIELFCDSIFSSP
jgi:pimeloyl-ACP methyl ester carboxylesterase